LSHEKEKAEAETNKSEVGFVKKEKEATSGRGKA